MSCGAFRKSWRYPLPGTAQVMGPQPTLVSENPAGLGLSPPEGGGGLRGLRALQVMIVV
jgi:hypothetical protein